MLLINLPISRILLYGATSPDKGREVGRISLQAEPVSLVYHGGQVFVGLANGHLNVYNRNLRLDIFCTVFQNKKIRKGRVIAVKSEIMDKRG